MFVRGPRPDACSKPPACLLRLQFSDDPQSTATARPELPTGVSCRSSSAATGAVSFWAPRCWQQARPRRDSDYGGLGRLYSRPDAFVGTRQAPFPATHQLHHQYNVDHPIAQHPTLPRALGTGRASPRSSPTARAGSAHPPRCYPRPTGGSERERPPYVLPLEGMIHANRTKTSRLSPSFARRGS